MADTQFHGLGDSAAPQDWTIPGSLTFTLNAARAVFDGTGAAGSFLPALEIISDAGLPVGTYVATSAVAAGSSADVSFAPFLGREGGGSSGSGIQFDVDNVGDWLEIETTGGIPTDPGVAVYIHGSGLNSGITLETDTQPIIIHGGGDLVHGGVQIRSDGHELTILHGGASAAPLIIDTDNGASIGIGDSNSASGNVNICGDPVFSGNTLSFFNSGGVGQAAHPTTLADVITILQNLGLCA